MISTASTEGLTIQLTWPEVRTLVAAIMVDQGEHHGIDDDEQFEMLELTSAQTGWVTEIVTTLNDALAKAGKQPWAKDPC